MFDAALALVCELDDYEYLFVERGWHAPGSFEIGIPEGSRWAGACTRERIVVFGNGSGAERCGVIEEVELSLDPARGMRRVVRGHELASFLARRLVYPPEGMGVWAMSGAAESVMKALVVSQAGTGAGIARSFGRFAVEEDQGRGEQVAVAARYTNLLTEVQGCARGSGLGYAVRFDQAGRRLLFSVQEGTDRSAGQGVHPRAILSPSWDTVCSGVVRESGIRERNFVLARGAEVQGGRLVAEGFSGLEAPSGLGRREELLDARSIDTQGALETAARAGVVRASVRCYARLELAPGSGAGLQLDEDFFLGDVVTMRGFGEPRDLRITAVEERVAREQWRIFVTLGERYPQAQVLAAERAAALEAALGAV